MHLPWLFHPEINEETLRSEKGVSLVAILDRAKPRKDGCYSIKVRIISGRLYKYYSTKVSVTEEEYLQMFKTRLTPELKNKRIVVYHYLKRAYEVINELKTFSFEQFSDKYYSKRSVGTDVFGYYDKYIQILRKEEREGTATNYLYSKKQLESFCGKPKLNFEAITPEFLKKYEKWMLANGQSLSTVGFYCRPLKKIYNDGISDGIVSKESFPFGDKNRDKYKIPAPENVKKALCEEDLRKLLTYKPEELSSEQRYYDMWIFSYLCNGINMKDLCLLKYKNIQKDIILFVREKTANTTRGGLPITIVLNEYNKAIIDRWGNPDKHPNNFIFDILTDDDTEKDIKRKVQQFTKQVNKYIKKVTVNVGIDDNVTTYTARHTFATMLMKLGAPDTLIRESLGHSDIKTTQSYLGSFEKDIKRKLANKLINF